MEIFQFTFWGVISSCVDEKWAWYKLKVDQLLKPDVLLKQQSRIINAHHDPAYYHII